MRLASQEFISSVNSTSSSSNIPSGASGRSGSESRNRKLPLVFIWRRLLRYIRTCFWLIGFSLS